MTLLKWIWAREPVIVALLGSAAFWPALAVFLNAFWHPLTPLQVQALLGLGTVIAGAVMRAQVTPTSGATAPPAVSETTRAGLVVLLAAALGLSACASLPRHPDGSLNVPVLLTWTQDGINVGCADQWLPADVCTFGTDAVRTAQAIAAKQPADIQAAVKASLLDSEAKLHADSRLRPYFDWVIAVL